MSSEKISNNAQTTLAADITTTTATAITVTSGSSFPPLPQFRILIDSEILLVTGVSGTTWTVTRGVEGSTAATHSNGAEIYGLLTKGGFDQRHADNRGADFVANILSNEKAGRLFFATDTPLLYRDDGTNWNPFGPLWIPSPPDDSTFVWQNWNAGDSVSQPSNRGPVYLYKGNNFGAGALLCRVKNLPGSTYDIVMMATSTIKGANYTNMSLVLTDGTKLYELYWAQGKNVWANYYSNGNTVGPDPTGGNVGYIFSNKREVWLRIKEDGTHRTSYISDNGLGWLQVNQVPTNDYLTPTKYGYGGLNTSGSDVLFTIHHFTP